MTSSEPWSRMFSGELSAIVVQCHVAAERVPRVNPASAEKLGRLLAQKRWCLLPRGMGLMSR